MAISKKTTVLFLAANPKATSQLRLDQEVRNISEGLLRSRNRDFIQLEQRWAVRSQDIQRAFLDINPQIVHFSGHGSGGEGIVLEKNSTSSISRIITSQPETDESLGSKSNHRDKDFSFVSADALADLFRLFSDSIRCVLLNACYSEIQAESIAQHIPYVIGMNRSISDDAAINFSVGFYDALGAGRSFEFAYEFGCNSIRMEDIQEYSTPTLKKNLCLINSLGLTNTNLMSSSLNQSDHKSSSTSEQRLQSRIEDLSGIHEELRKKINKLRKDYIIEADSEAKYKLEQRINDYEAQLQDTREKLDSLESQ